MSSRFRVATNDYLIEMLIADPNYSISSDGSIWRLKGKVWQQTAKAVTQKQGKQYFHLKYRGKMLVAHRIVYRKFNGPLDQYLIVDHIDGNGLNNDPSNLQLITQQLNCFFKSATI